MPAARLDTFVAAAEAFPACVEIAWSDGAIALADASLDVHGLLLLGEFHGVAENPLIVEAVAGVDRGLTEDRDEAMADAIAGLRGRVLFVGGNVHAP